jgi:hypothetical protein
MIPNNKMTTFYKKKDDMFNAVGYDKPYYFSKDISTDGAFKEFFWSDDINDVKEILEVDNNIYEIIAENKSRYSYFDLDGTYQSFKKHINDDMYIDDFILKKFIDYLQEFKETFGFKEDVDNLVVLQGTKPNKISFHIIDKSVVLKNCYECNLYHKKFIEYLIENESCLLDLIDKGVYDKDRNFRCINQSKMSKTPYPLKSKAEISDTLVCCKETPTDIPILWKMTNFIVKPPEKVVVDNAEVELLLQHISDDRWTDYQLWIQTVWCLLACNIDTDLIHDLSYEICPDKYDKNGLNCVIKNYDPKKNSYTMNTLRKWAEIDTGFKVEQVFEKPVVVLDEKRENHMTWIIFQKKYNKKIFLDNIGLDEFCIDCDKVISYIQVGEAPLFTLYVNRNEQFKIVNKLNKLTIAFASSENQKDKPKFMTVQEFIVDNPSKFTYFDNIVCKPNNYKLQKFERNIWSGFKAQKVEVVDMSIVNVLLNHIREVWCCNDDKQYKYILSWFAQIIQTPYKKTAVALVLYGRQGTGKSLPLDIMLEYVFGKDISLATTGIGRLTGNFNNSLRGKLFTKCDEVSSINSGNENFHAVFDKMKDNITGNILEIEQKGKDCLQIDNINNFVFTTNNSFSIKIEENDRRYNPLEVSDKYMGNHEYFDNFLEVLSNENAGNHILTFFLEYKDLIDVRKIPMTELKKDMIRKSKNNSIRFIEEGLPEIIEDLTQSKNRELDELYDWKGDDGKDAITVCNLYDFYINWVQSNHEKSVNKNIFSSNIKYLVKNSGRTRIDKVQKRWVQF